MGYCLSELVIKMKFRRYVGFTVFGLMLLLSLTILPSIQAQYTADGQAFTLVSPIFIVSPENTTYTTNQVCLKFVVQSYVNARVNNMTMLYSLDGNDNVTILPINVVGDVGSGIGDGKTVVNVVSGSVTLEGLQPGSHSLTVFGIYATHQSPKTGFDSQTVYFTIDADSNSLVESNSLTENSC